MGLFNPKSWLDPIEDVGNAIKDTVVDAAQEVARNVVSVAEVVGDGITDAAGLVGDGVVTMGESVGKFSVTAAGDVVDWSKTSFEEVRDWTEGAAGDLAGFTVRLYEGARDELIAAGKFLLEQIANFFTETLPTLGPIDPTVRAVAVALLTEDVVRGLERTARATYCTLTFGLKAQALGTATCGLYVCGEGWGLFSGATLDVIKGAVTLLTQGASISASVAMIFGPRERASGTKAIKLGVGLTGKAAGKPSLGIGGVVLMEPKIPPLFLGFRYEVSLTFGLGGKKQPGQDGKVTWKVAITKPSPNGDFYNQALEYADLALEEVSDGLGGAASNWDAAVRAFGDPDNADRIVATAASAALSPFAPRYYGGIRAAYGHSKAPRERQVIGSRQGAIGVVGVTGELRTTFCVVAGLADPRHVSIEAVGDPTLYWYADPQGGLRLVPYSKTMDTTRATFRMVRGLRGSGVAFALAADPPNNPRFIVCTNVLGDMVLPSNVLTLASFTDQKGVDRFRDETTFLLDLPVDPPIAESAILREGEVLTVGATRRAPNGRFSLLLASNGRLVVRRREQADMSSPNAWLVYEPGIIQDAVLLWAFASPGGVDDGKYYARVSGGRIEVRRGTPAADAGLHWQSEVHGSPGHAFVALSNQGVIMVVQGDPADTGEVLWTSPTGALHWPTRRQTAAIQAPSGAWWIASQGGGKGDPEALIPPAAQPVKAASQQVGAWEHFEISELWSGKVAIRAQARRFVGLVDGGAVLEVGSNEAGPRQLFTLEVVATPAPKLRQVRLKADANGRYVGVAGDGSLVADRDQAGAAIFKVFDLEHDLTAHSGRAFHVIAKHSGLCIEPPSGAPDQGTGLVQRRLDGHEHQKWCLRYNASGDYTLINRATGKVVDITGSSAQSGAVALQWPEHGGNNQRFLLRPTGDGTYHLIARHSGKTLDVHSSRTDSGAPIIQWDLSGSDNQRFELRLADPGKTSIWRPLGGGLTSAPSIASWGPGRLDVCARGRDEAVWQMWSDGTWRSWTSMGGRIPADVTVLAPTPNRLDLFVRGMDGAVWQRWWDGAKWNGWASLGGVILGGVGALGPVPGRWDLFVRGTEYALYQKTYVNGWSGFGRLGGQITSTPVPLYVDGRWYVFVRGSDGALWVCWYGGAWNWQKLDVVFQGEPTATSCGPGCIDVFVRGGDSSLINRAFRGGQWRAPVALGGVITTDPAAISSAPGRVDVVVRGTDNALWGRRLEGESWQPWRRYGGELSSRPAVASSAPGQVDVAALSADQSLWVGTLR
ncbi:MAG: RICIN domain-containing protein [Nannocystaceae bacterium]